MKFVGHRFGFGSLPLKADTGGNGKPTLDLTWNGLYQLVSVSTNGVFAEGYAYDALGRRVSTTTAEGTTRHVDHVAFSARCELDELKSGGNSVVLARSKFRTLLKGATRVLLGVCKGKAWEEFPLGETKRRARMPLIGMPESKD